MVIDNDNDPQSSGIDDNDNDLDEEILLETGDKDLEEEQQLKNNESTNKKNIDESLKMVPSNKTMDKMFEILKPTLLVVTIVFLLNVPSVSNLLFKLPYIANYSENSIIKSVILAITAGLFYFLITYFVF
jgi:uncharacterized membrane-anchored protein